MAKTFDPNSYKIENVNDNSLFKNFREELVGDLGRGFSAINTDLDDLYNQIGNIPEVVPAEDQMVSFDMAEAKEELSSQDTIKVLFGKIANWFSSFGNLAWKNTVETNDVAKNTITDDKLAKMPAKTFKGNISETAAAPSNLTTQEVKEFLSYTAEEVGAANTDHTHSYTSITDKPNNFLPTAHADSHRNGGTDAISPEDIGALTSPVVKIFENAGTITLNVEDNAEYVYTGVTGLTIVLNNNSAHGFITFGNSVTAPVYSASGNGFYSGDDVTAAAAGEKWEFDILNGCMLWKKWGAATS